MANVTLAGFVYNNAGSAISGATVEAFPRNTTTTATSNTTTNSSGYWSLAVSTEGRYDVRITYGSSVRFIKYDDSAQMEELEVANLHIRNPANTFDYDIVPAAIVADRQLNLPLITATDTLTTVGLAQTWSAIQTHSADIVLQDAVDVAFGTDSNALARWSAADSSNEALVIGLGTLNSALHLANIGGVATDWNVSAEADPQLFIHCNTNPATEYLRIGNLDATNAEIDLVGGTTLKFQIDGTDEMTLTASAIDFKDNNLSNVGTVALDGGQIAFPATQVASGDANTLDDYEEGTFTPTIGDNTRNGTSENQQYTTQIGHYTKIGNWVHFMLTVVMSDKGDMTTSDQAAILGLPFSTANVAHTTFPIVVGDATSLALGSAGQVVSGFVAYNNDQINLRLWDATGGVTDCTVAEISDGAKLNVSGNYKVA